MNPDDRKVLFPPNRGQRYYETHHLYVANLLRYGGWAVEFDPTQIDLGAAFSMRVCGEPVLMDYSDHFRLPGLVFNGAVFKFHAQPGQAVLPWAPISFYDWAQYGAIWRGTRYDASGDTIVCRQRPGGRATEIRAQVQATLRKAFGRRALTDWVPQQLYWQGLAGCLANVCVPGARPDILDRSQWQSMGMGVCTISPRLSIVLPGGVIPKTGEHYVACRSDFSDLVEVIGWCAANRDQCRQIGHQAKALFLATGTPNALGTHLVDALSKTGMTGVRG